MGTDHGEALFPRGHSRRTTDTCAYIDDTLHPVQPIQPPCADVGDELGYALRVCIPLGLLHEESGHGDARAGSEIARCFVCFVEFDQAAGSHHVLRAFRVFNVVIGVLRELGFELSDLMLQMDNIVAIDLLIPGGVEILANRARPFTGETSR